MKKRLISMLLSVSLLVSLFTVSGSAATADQAFTDVSTEAWYYEAVQYVYENGLMNGMGNNKFEPDTTLSRAMFVTILGRMAGIDEDDYTGSTGFTDAPAGSWYSPYVKWAAENGIVNGMTATTFAPDNAITREQMAAILVRYVENNDLYLPNSSKAIASFTDEASISEWAEELVDQARAWGIFEGDNGNFTPQSKATRAQAATVFMRLAEYLYLSSPEADSLMDTDEEHIATDEETGIQYVNNTVLAFIQNYLTDEEKQSIADLVDGEIVGQLSGALDMLQIQVEVSTLTELEAMADTLETSELVYSATYNMLMEANGEESNSSDSDDWWQEMIGLDKTWDEFGDYFGDDTIKVGVIDENVDVKATSLNSRVVFALLGGETVSDNDTDEDGKAHGTRVCSLLVGSNGILNSAPAAKCYFASYSHSIVDDVTTSSTDFTRVAIALSAEIEAGCRVINNSYGYYYFDEAGFYADADLVSAYNSYSEYLLSLSGSCVSSAEGIAALSCALLRNNDKILFVQGAGNGINNEKSVGTKVDNSGYWASTNEIRCESICNQYGMTYQQLKDHILIVTAVNESYSYTGFNYGAAVDIAAPQTSTSRATPLVTGTAALVWAADPDLSAAEVKEILVTSSQKEATSSDYSGTVPVLNTYLSVQEALYAYYSGTVLNADGTAAEYLTVYAKDEDGNILYEGNTGSDGSYFVWCNRLEIDHVDIVDGENVVASVDVSDEYKIYDFYATNMYSEDDREEFAPHDLGAEILPVDYLSMYAEVLEEYTSYGDYFIR